jgi:uncharacterized protein
MRFTLDAGSGINLIRSYQYGSEVRVGERSVQTSCIVSADTLIQSWKPNTVDELTSEHLAPIFELKPEVVLLGTGSVQRFPDAAIRSAFASRGIGLEVMELGAACRTYNVLVQEDRRVVAALMLN